MGSRSGITLTRLVRDLKQCCPSLKTDQKTGGKDREPAFKLPLLDEARKEWSERMHMEVAWT